MTRSTSNRMMPWLVSAAAALFIAAIICGMI
jgi:hypothetical protein